MCATARGPPNFSGAAQAARSVARKSPGDTGGLAPFRLHAASGRLIDRVGDSRSDACAVPGNVVESEKPGEATRLLPIGEVHHAIAIEHSRVLRQRRLYVA